MVATLIRGALGLAGILVALAGLTVSLAHLGRTRWAGALAAGFGLEAVTALFYRVATPLLARAGFGRGFELGLLAAQLLGLVGALAVVAGVAGVLAELRDAAERRDPGGDVPLAG